MRAAGSTVRWSVTSAAVRALRTAVAEQAARTEPLLLTGPPGAGKEAVAHAVHVASDARGAFIFVSCPELHAQSTDPIGSGAAMRRHGVPRSKLELASGGTLFLDAVHELPPELQQRAAELAVERDAHAAAIAGTRRAADCFDDARSDARDGRAARAVPPPAARESHRRAGACRSARGHSRARRSFRAEAGPTDEQDRGRRVAGVDAPAGGVRLAGQHPRAADGARARHRPPEELGAGDRRRAPRRTARRGQLSSHGAAGLGRHG